MTTYAYIRVSTDAQDLNNQRHGVIEYAKKHGLEPLSFFEDTASGKKSWKARDLGKLLDQARAGDVLVVAEISRLARSTLQVLEILQEAAKQEIAVHVAKSNMVMDGSLNSRITAVVLGLAAEIEREFISARTTEALARRKAEGKPLGRPKGRVSAVHKLDKDQDKIKEMLAKGVHKTSIARLLGCNPDTLYEWMKANGLSRHIKSRKPAAPVPVSATKLKRKSR
ncbi:Site-specific DNA recombinase [Methylomagnum ishizawai]|uniref:Site-specific DNA recombinase n=1 Tax=Methylomagnum ishizawai TaxID=1760988 RepID=A0A1Y6D569_9GAMM|nr:recombinase family protein [Methylomagnum ishizawai]SMF95682.1 Site-specific DNA recombinase [Methylomagnum ishizawai]